jgi:hypothetical protein
MEIHSFARCAQLTAGSDTQLTGRAFRSVSVLVVAGISYWTITQPPRVGAS